MFHSLRRGQRVMCADKCHLVSNGRYYTCILENISVSGILLNLIDVHSVDIKPGDTCG